MASSLRTPHIVVFPFMAYGHTLPLLDLSKVLSRHKVKVTIITTPANAESITQNIDGFQISIIELPFPAIDGLPEGCENISGIPSMDLLFPFIIASKQLQKPFELVLQSMKNSEDPPVCVISDFVFHWTLESCQRFEVLRLAFNGMGILPFTIIIALWFKKLRLKSSSIFDHLNLLEKFLKLPFSLTTLDIPEELLITNNSDPVIELIADILESEAPSWGTIANSFQALEGEYVPALESFYASGAKAWCLGPMFLKEKMEVSDEKMGNRQDPHSTTLMKWLDMHANEKPKSVIYVSFGTLAHVSDAQLEEVALGLEESDCPFVLVIRSNTWSAPNGMAERVKNKGLITREFVDQRRVLFHSAIGGFLSHCGWNSVLESMSASVPILAWPIMGDQKVNAKYIVDGLGFGVGIANKSTTKDSGGLICRQKISASVKELMEGEKGRKAREKAIELGRLANQAVEDGGSSNETLKSLLQELNSRANSLASMEIV